MSEPKNGPSLKLIVVAVLLLLVSAAVVAIYVPLVECAACEGTGKNKLLHGAKGSLVGSALAACPVCKSGKATLLQKFRVQAMEKSILPSNPLPR